MRFILFKARIKEVRSITVEKFIQEKNINNEKLTNFLNLAVQLMKNHENEVEKEKTLRKIQAEKLRKEEIVN
jgi:hypothetical protein